MNRSMKRKAAKTRRNALLVVALMLVVCIASIGGTIAWLTDSTDEVKNTFAPSGIDIDLNEHQYDPATDSLTNEEVKGNDGYKLVPGKVYPKDPFVTVKAATDVPVYLFVQVDEGACKTYLDYQLAWEVENSGWTKLTGEGIADNTVYYRIVEPLVNPADQTWKLIVGDQVTVKTGLQKADNDDTTLSMPAGNQTMTFTAYAIQSDNLPFAEGADDNAKALTAWGMAKTGT